MRRETSVPQQALFLMNSPFMIGRAKALAKRMGGESSAENLADKIQRTYQVVFQRKPTPEQVERSIRYILQHPSEAVSLLSSKAKESPWLYGVGEFVEAEGVVKGFKMAARGAEIPTGACPCAGSAA